MTFSDVQNGDWYHEWVQCLYCHGAISGYSDGTFRPYANTTRSQMTKIVVLGLGIPINAQGAPHFFDVRSDNPFYPYVETAANANIVSGYEDRTFRPYTYVTRGQLSKIVVSAAILMYHWPLITPSLPSFRDVGTDDAFYSFVETAVCHSVLTGYSDGTFRPGAEATRAQIAKIVCLTVTNTSSCGQ